MLTVCAAGALLVQFFLLSRVSSSDGPHVTHGVGHGAPMSPHLNAAAGGGDAEAVVHRFNMRGAAASAAGRGSERDAVADASAGGATAESSDAAADASGAAGDSNEEEEEEEEDVKEATEEGEASPPLAKEEPFRCDSDRGWLTGARILARARVNDGYCDCDDGTDEASSSGGSIRMHHHFSRTASLRMHCRRSCSLVPHPSMRVTKTPPPPRRGATHPSSRAARPERVRRRRARRAAAVPLRVASRVGGGGEPRAPRRDARGRRGRRGRRGSCRARGARRDERLVGAAVVRSDVALRVARQRRLLRLLRRLGRAGRRRRSLPRSVRDARRAPRRGRCRAPRGGRSGGEARRRTHGGEEPPATRALRAGLAPQPTNRNRVVEADDRDGLDICACALCSHTSVTTALLSRALCRRD